MVNAALLDRAGRERFVESLLVVVIVAVLVTMAADSFRFVLGKVQMLEAESLSRTHLADVGAFRAVTGRWPEQLPERVARVPPGRYFSGVEWRDDELVFSMVGAAPQRPDREPASPTRDDEQPTLAFRAAVEPVSGITIWLCGNRAPPPGFTAPAPQHTSLPSASAPHFCRARQEGR